ncbi:DMT family transporter [Paraburkholderia sp. BR14261]
MRKTLDSTTDGWLCGLAGVLIFSGSLPATRLAVLGFAPVFLTSVRATIAGMISVLLLLALRAARPARAEVWPLGIVALGVGVGFPLLTALALQHVSSAHASVFVGLLPLATAVFGVLRAGERPQPAFWIFSAAGSAAVGAFALRHGIDASPLGDALMLGAIVVCGLGYAEGARLSRRLGGWQVICWALVISLPVMAPLAWWLRPASFAAVGAASWWGLAYVSLFSMLIGFVFWYRGLALGGIAGVGQLQLLQPFFGFVLAALLLHEAVPPAMIAVTAVVIACVAGARRFGRAGGASAVANRAGTQRV